MGKTLQKIVFSFGVIVSIFIFAAVVKASITANVNNLLSSPSYVKGNSATTTAMIIGLTASAGETLTAVTVNVADTGSTGFAVTDLASLSATSTTSGIGLYGSNGFIALNSTPSWNGSGPYSLTLTPQTPVSISSSSTTPLSIVFKTAPGLNSSTHQFSISLSSNSIATSANSPTINQVSTAPITIDAVAPADILAANFTLGNNQLAVKNNLSIGTNGSTAKVYDTDGTTLLGQSTIGGSGQFMPISINTTTYTSVKVQVNDQAGNLSNMVVVNVTAAPSITAVAAFTDRIVIDLSQNVDGMQAMNCANYVINGSAATCGGNGYPFVDFNGNRIAIRALNLQGTVSFAIPSNNTITSIDGLNNRLTAYSSSTVPVQELVLPTITGISPSVASVGDTVTITGTNFGTLGSGSMGDGEHRVFFSGGFSQETGPSEPIEADYTGGSWSNTSIVVKVPTGAQAGGLNIKAGDLMNDMGQNTFFDVLGTYNFKVYYSGDTGTPMPDGDNGNIRVMIGSPAGQAIYYVGDGDMTYNATTDTFSIAGVASSGFSWAYDITGAHLNSAGQQMSIASTRNLFMPATERIISGTLTLGSTCTANGQNKSVVVFPNLANVDSGDENFKEVQPSFFTTNGSCVATYAVGVPVNGTYNIEAHIPPITLNGITVSTPYTDPASQTVTLTDSAKTATKNFTFVAATHRIVGTVQKPSGSFTANELNDLWVYAYQPQGGKGTGAQVAANGTFSLNVAKGVWKVGVSGNNMPSAVETQIDVDDTYLIGQPAKGPTLIIAPPSDYIEGYVKDSASNGIANASVYAWREGGSGNGNAKTDSQGYYKMYVNAGTNYHVGANSQSFGFLGEQTGVTVSSQSHPTVNFSVASTNYAISGTVTKGGVGLQQAFVFITDGERGQMLGSGNTDSSGAYSARVSAGASRWIHVGLPGKGEIYTENLGTISGNTTKNVALTTSTITVRISPASDFEQAFVGVHSNQGGGFSDVNVASSSASYREYKIDMPRPGSGSTLYYIEGGIPGYGPLPQSTITLNSNGTFTETSGTANDGIIVYTLSGLYSVSGTVSGDGVGGAWVWAAGPNGGNGAQTAEDGTYTLKLRDGVYDVGVNKPGYIGNKIITTVSGANLTGQNLTLAAAANTISGTVYLPDGITKVTNAWVWATNTSGGWSGASTNANGAYTLGVGDGSWQVYAAYDGYNSAASTVTAPATGANITLVAIAGFNANVKNTPITPSNGGIIQEEGIKVDFPKNTLGTDTAAGVIEIKNTTNVPTIASTKVIGNAREITARNSSNQSITTLSGSITIELTVTKEEIEAQDLTFAQVQGMKISYWDSTANNWVEIPTTVTMHPAAAATIDDLDSDPAVTLSGTVSHLSSFAPTVPSIGAPTTPTGLTATAASSSQINLVWTQVSAATGYDIYRSTSANGTFTKLGSEPTVSSGSTVSYSSTGLNASTTYYYKISSVNGTGESAASSAVSAITQSSGGSSGISGGSSAVVTPKAEEKKETPKVVLAGKPFSQMTRAEKIAKIQEIKTLLLELIRQYNELTGGKIKVSVKDIPAGFKFQMTLKPGSNSTEVKYLQSFLKSQGTDIYPEGIINGNYGPVTTAAVKRFQEKYASEILAPFGLASGSGIAGSNTIAKMNSLLNK